LPEKGIGKPNLEGLNPMLRRGKEEVGQSKWETNKRRGANE